MASGPLIGEAREAWLTKKASLERCREGDPSLREAVTFVSPSSEAVSISIATYSARSDLITDSWRDFRWRPGSRDR